MRLWHKDLIDVLPKQQLLAQWRECCAIARQIGVNGQVNHILVNRINDYPVEHFMAYCGLVHSEFIRRGYSCNMHEVSQWIKQDLPEFLECTHEDIFYDWHNARYMWQCYTNLEEKHDCGGIPDEEWANVETRMRAWRGW